MPSSEGKSCRRVASVSIVPLRLARPKPSESYQRVVGWLVPLFQCPHGVVEAVQRLVGVGQRHRGAETVMARCPRVVVEIDALADRRRDKLQHPLTIVLDRI